VKIRLLTASVLLALMVQGVRAQDARTVLQAVSQNIGADKITTLQIAGSKGYSAAAGAPYSADQDWPLGELVSYTKDFDFNAHFSREQIARRSGPFSPIGGTQGIPIRGAQKFDFVLNGATAWAVAGGGFGPYDRQGYMDGIPVAEMWQLDLIMVPQGFVKAALAPGANPTIAMTIGPRGHQLTYVSITAVGKYRVTAGINEQNEIETVTTHVANPAFGDMLYAYTYGPYKQYGAVKFPTTIHRDEGDPNVSPAHNAFYLEVSSVQANAPVQVFTPTTGEKLPADDSTPVDSQKLADGVWYIAGKGVRHASVAVECPDFVVVVEAPLSELRSIVVINEVHRLVPNKPIKYLVSTHYHFDHMGGIRTYAAEGATIVASAEDADVYRRVVLSPAPRTLEPDRLSLLPPDKWPHELLGVVTDKYVISDKGQDEVVVYPMPAFEHVSSMTVAYIPRAKMIINADVYGPPAPGKPLPRASAGALMLYETIQRLGLDVTTQVGIHGGAGSEEDFIKVVTQPEDESKGGGAPAGN
jgi:glyoxylase-like metal-dependent hydrolase (beta-lactamase superfamily II)